METENTRSAIARTGLDVVVSGVMSDAHTWNLVYLQLLLEELGHRVVNLGPCVPGDLLVAECEWRRPDLIVLSSVNGHGAQDGLLAIERLRACPELADCPVIIGGKLGVRGADEGDRSAELLAAGFDAVFDDAGGVTAFRSFVGSLEKAALRAGTSEAGLGTAPASLALEAGGAR
ncbi:methylaspartate mutase sigma subunit [Streptomyces sp. 1114.5]|uniref:cobalamin B12-binding domain-containing protein n=1 Tax=unclassified Streptomyces TaxID=2593676 RepID=UPI000BDA913E|nr:MULTISPECIES: cobalamin-dependent protein [unclassified Streptomyces]RKT19359.1 methylaspartate mutase sigma subunit [Streptomyces sp. 1114.5]SOB85556.1 methylaspartate mutase sigma subunit [Streptomyces sp. 1331.2]